MKVTYNWLKDFVAIKIPPRVLAAKLTMAGLEVTGIEERDADTVYEIEITSNRPDWLSVIGVAREVAAITRVPLKIPPFLPVSCNKNTQEKLEIDIENKSDCPLYSAKIIRNVKVSHSPELIRRRLELIGCRPVNNIVDITNYCLFETGEPLHAFDLDKLKGGKIIVRRAKAGERIITIDGQERLLSGEVLVIADASGPVAVAGVMGGKYTEIGFSTKNILLEAAVFNPALIRKGRRLLGLSSESSYRFERGVDSETAANASNRASHLIKNISGGDILLAKASGKPAPKSKSITLGLDSVDRVLGIKIAPNKIRSMLRRLGLDVKNKGSKALKIGIPARRNDLLQEVDIIEELARIYGYENIPTTFPSVRPQITTSNTRSLVSELKNILSGLGLFEVITYSLMDREQLKVMGFSVNAGLIGIQNPLSREQEMLRPTLLPGLLKCIATNINQKQEYLSVFEIANIFHDESGKIKEELFLGLAVCGHKNLLYPGHGVVREELGVLNLKGMIEALFLKFKIGGYSFVPSGSLIMVKIKEEVVGKIQEIDENLLGSFDIKGKSAAVAELSLDRILSRANLSKRFTPLPKFPAITRDISIVLPENVFSDKIISLILDKGAPLLKEARITDYYKGKQIPDGFKGLTVSCVYRSPERTLTENDVNPVHDAVCASLTDSLDARIRG
jgi:phenylalanyl-tRNA synthetase beta chain